MVYKPRTEDSVYESLRGGLIERISKLTNFVETSFNSVWTRTFSSRFRDNEVALLAAQLSGWVDYAGGPISQDDLNTLGIDDVEPFEVNEFMSDEDLENLVEIVGVERDPGQEAGGTVTFTTVSSFTEIPEGTSVGTQPDAQGDFFEYTTDGEVQTVSGDTKVDAPINAVEVGDEYNVGSLGRISYLPSPPTGVEDVTNENSITGGEDREANQELRERAKDSIFNKSGGGTAKGVEGFVESNVDAATSVSVAEYPGGNASLSSDSPSPGGPGGSSSTAPFADVIVELSSKKSEDIQATEDAIDESRPVAIQHNRVKPTLIEVNVTADVTGRSIETGDVEEAISDYIDDLDLGDSVFRDKIIQRALNADSGVENIEDLNVAISEEKITYVSGTSVYNLLKGVQMENDGITNITDENSANYTEGTDYEETDDDNDGSDDSIDWSIGGSNPSGGTTFKVTYDIIDDIPIDQYEIGDTKSINVNVV